MRDVDLFTMALGLVKPWRVVRADFQPENHRLDIYIDFEVGGRFSCPVCDFNGSAYDTADKTWQHMNFFQHEAFIHARTPRISCPEHDVHLINVPWARPGSGFTLLFEALLMTMAKEMSITGVSKLAGVKDKRIWRVLQHYVDTDLENQDLSAVRNFGVDETSSKRGHAYITVVADMDTKKAIFVTEGKDAGTLKAFKEHLETHNGSASQIEGVSSDMSPAFISGIEDNFPGASITFDRFHVVKLLNEAVNTVRKQEAKIQAVLRGTKYIWLSNHNNLSSKNLANLASLNSMNLKTSRAWRLLVAFKFVFKFTAERATDELKRWYSWAIRSRLQPILAFCKMLKKHWDGIVESLKSGLSNGTLEALNGLVQLAKRRARGYRSIKNLKTMTYIVAGGLGKVPI